jgi:SAM-dependent methyltransferase
MEKKLESYFNNDRLEILNLLPGNYFKVLEIGCGTGAFRAQLKDDIEYWGVDPYLAVGIGLNTKMHKFFNNILEEVEGQLPDNYFDLIIINDVMEHTTDHLYFLSLLRKKLILKGFIVGSVPNVRFILNLSELLIEKDWNYKESGGILDNTHLRFFTKKSLCNTFNKADFQIEICKGINPIWMSKYPLHSLIKKIFYNFIGIIIGKDIIYMQFGFRCKLKVNK